MKIAIGADERLPIVDAALIYLKEEGHQVEYYGPLHDDETQLWPQVAKQVTDDLAQSKVEQGILFCWTGTGMSIAANKAPGIRAALCNDAETARGAKLWNDANVLCLSLRQLSEAVLEEILQTWFDTDYQPNAEDDACLQALAKLQA